MLCQPMPITQALGKKQKASLGYKTLPQTIPPKNEEDKKKPNQLTKQKPPPHTKRLVLDKPGGENGLD